MLRFIEIKTFLISATVLVAGCGQNFFPESLPLLSDVLDGIVNDGSLDPQEKRDKLAAYGIDDVTINTLLRDERLANQFGGDLTSAMDKVENSRFATLTPDEVQYFGDATDLTTYADAEALAITELFQDESINSSDDLQAFLDDPATELPTAIDETNLKEVFINASLDTIRDKLS